MFHVINQQQSPTQPIAQPSAQAPSQAISPNGGMARTLDEALRSMAMRCPDCPIVADPSYGASYIKYTYRQLDEFAYRAAQQYAGLLPLRVSSTKPEIVVGLLGLSTLVYLIARLALSKLGFTVQLLSTNLTAVRNGSLLSTCLLAGVTGRDSSQVFAGVKSAHSPFVVCL